MQICEMFNKATNETSLSLVHSKFSVVEKQKIKKKIEKKSKIEVKAKTNKNWMPLPLHAEGFIHFDLLQLFLY